MSKPRIFSGVQPSGNLHIGNYLGAISQFVALQKDYDCVFCVVDYHAITVLQNPEELKKKIIDIAKIYLAAGIDPENSIIFQQSDIKEHTELGWVLNTITRMSDLNKMTQFKDKGGDNENVGVGLFDYPVLMAADILLYDTEVVPVGDDQLQHVELARDLAKRFNHQFKSDTFIIPKAEIRKEGARIMGLDNPEKKMSKSASSEYNYIALTDDVELAKKKIMKAVADSGNEVKYDPENKPGISNLLVINSLLSNKKIEDLEKEYQGMMYGDFKKKVAEAVAEFLTSFQEKYNKISDDEVRAVLDAGVKKALPLAQATMERVKKTIGVK
jgi:tryptophanyl-tRNA synthetase